MTKVQAKAPSLKEVLDEVRALRREISMFLPAESLEGFKNPKRILDSYKKAIAKHPNHAGASNRRV